MRTEPRRKDRIMKNPRDMELLLERMPVGRLGVTTKDGPYVVPVNYLFFDGAIYFHSAPVGLKAEALRADPRVCFEVDEAGPQVLWDKRCGITQIYKSVLCYGRAEFLEGLDKKRDILERMLTKYVPAGNARSPMKDQAIEGTAIVKIAIGWMSGKENLLAPFHKVIANSLWKE